jgi:flagellar basal body-associated protein FliL
MMAVLVILFVVVLLLAGIAGTLYTIVLAKKQDERDVKRSLEMVSLLIHLPPISEDTSVGGRDARDVVDETISKAQIVYNIIAVFFSYRYLSGIKAGCAPVGTGRSSCPR